MNDNIGLFFPDFGISSPSKNDMFAGMSINKGFYYDSGDLLSTYPPYPILYILPNTLSTLFE